MQPFIFNFYDEENEKHHDYFFCIDINTIEGLNSFIVSQKFEDFISDNEDYGVHNVSYTEPFFLGYTSDEVEPSEQEECFYNIINFFRKNGYKVVNIEDFEYVEDSNFNSLEWYLNKIKFRG